MIGFSMYIFIQNVLLFAVRVRGEEERKRDIYASVLYFVIVLFFVFTFMDFPTFVG